MAIRYFKCHTLPYPCYSLSATTTAASSVDLAWQNGPPGESTPTAHIEYATVAASTSTTVATVSGTLQTAKVTGLVVASPTDYQFRIRRENTAGFGEWTPYATVTVTP